MANDIADRIRRMRAMYPDISWYRAGETHIGDNGYRSTNADFARGYENRDNDPDGWNPERLQRANDIMGWLNRGGADGEARRSQALVAAKANLAGGATANFPDDPYKRWQRLLQARANKLNGGTY